MSQNNFFPVRETEQWHRLPREVVESLSLETCRSCLATVLGSGLWVSLLEGSA